MNRHELALKRRNHGDAGTRERLDTAGRLATNWYTRCPICGTFLKGSLAEMMAHRHDDEPR